jgi:energy-coupling factor transporter ATP-binding protein EcfA2
MLIERIDIESFGPLKNFHVTTTNSRINVFYGSNESGKSTVAAFIKFMFFGYAGADLQELGKNEKKLYTPWTTNKVAGSIIVHCRDRKYKIEREYSDAARERTRIIDLSTNITLQNTEEPGEFFFKMNEEVFTKTAFLKQFGTSEIGGDDLAAMIQNILFTADEDVNTQKTLGRLGEAKNRLIGEEGEGASAAGTGIITALAGRTAGLKNSFENSVNDQKELMRMEGMIKDLEEKMLTNNAKKNELTDELENYRAYNASQELQKIEGARRQADMLGESAEKTVAKYSHGDFIPTMEFSRRLLDASEQVREKKEKLEANKEQRNMSLKKYNECIEKNKSFKIIENAGGTDEVGEEYINLKKSAQALRILKTVCLIMLFLSAGGAAALYFFDIFKNLFMFGFAPLFFGGTLLLIFAGKNKRIEIEEFYKQFEFETEGEFAAVLDDYPDTEAQIEILKRDLDEYENIVLDSEKEFDGIYSGARDLLLQWNRTPESDDKSHGDFIKYSKLALDAAEEIQKAQSLYGQFKTKLDAMLEANDERSLRNLAAAARKPNYDEKQIARELEFLSKTTESLREKENDIGKNIAAISAKLPDPVILKSQIMFLEEKTDELTTKHNALKLAIDTLVYSCNELKNSIAPRLSELAGSLFRTITGEKYEDLIADRSLGLEITDDNLKKRAEHFSAGTRDAAYLCLRMALLELLFDEEMPPLICDEPFQRIDSRRLENMLKVIFEMSRKTQVFIFTCHEREANMLRKIDANIMTMPGEYGRG